MNLASSPQIQGISALDPRVLRERFAAVRPTTEQARGLPNDEERRRLQLHFVGAILQLGLAPTDLLSPAQREARVTMLAELIRYAARGVFPKNDEREIVRPIFVDKVGTRCAVAHLLDASGEHALVESVQASDNYGYVPALARSPQLAAWLDRVGLSVSEAARIQPEYCTTPAEDCLCHVMFTDLRPATLVLGTVAHVDNGQTLTITSVVSIADAEVEVGQVLVLDFQRNGTDQLKDGSVVLAEITPSDVPAPQSNGAPSDPDAALDVVSMFPMVDGDTVYTGMCQSTAGTPGVTPLEVVAAARERAEPAECAVILEEHDDQWTEVACWGVSGCSFQHLGASDMHAFYALAAGLGLVVGGLRLRGKRRR